MIQIYDKMAREIEQHVQHVIGIPVTNPLYVQMTSLLETVVRARNFRDVQTAIAVLQKVMRASVFFLIIFSDYRSSMCSPVV